MIEEAPQKVVTLYSESTPNPESMKFVSNRYIVQGKSLDFPDLHSSKKSPLAQKLFEFPFVKSVFISDNFVTVQKGPEDQWYDIIPILKDFLKSYLEADLSIVDKDYESTIQTGNIIENRIQEVLNDYVRPAVQQDGGAIVFRSFDEERGVLKLQMQGACSGCPSSMITLKSGIENLMTKMIPEVKEVVAEQGR